MISLIRLRAPIRYNDALQMQHVHGAELEGCAQKQARLILLQHTPVYTLGRRTEAAHLPLSENDLAARTGAELVHVDRGGSITYHGPGQLTAYLLLNLQAWGLSVHQHLEMLEETVIHTLKRFGLSGRRETGMTGVWVEPELGAPAEKVCAIGISARRWVTYHGLSLNVDLDLAPFREIIPCGLQGKGVTCMARLLKRPVGITEVETALAAACGEVYASEVETGMV
jgi:lipoate-protein ligase B